jgi:hypothetical protein
MVCLALHRAQTTVLPCHPLLRTADVQRVCEREFVVCVVRPSQVGKDRETFHNREAALIVVYDDRDAAVGAQLRKPCVYMVSV